MSLRPKAFILMPFATEFDDIYEYLIRGSLSDAGFDVIRADDIRNQRNILADVVQNIVDGDLIVADLSTANSNVYYELGLAHAIGKPVILLAQDIEEVPFDLQSYRILIYATHFSRMNDARKELFELAKGALENTIQFGSPVSDFTTLFRRNKINGLSQLDRITSKKIDERGLLDFQAEVEDGFSAIASVMTEVGNRFNVLTPEVQSVSEQLRQNISTSKRRSIVRTLATSLDEYAKWLAQGNAQYRQALGQISESLNALFSGEFEIEEDAKSELQNFVSVLRVVEQQAQHGQESISNLVSTMENLPRIEKEFNLAKRGVSEELKELIGNVDQTVAMLIRARNAAARFLGTEGV